MIGQINDEMTFISNSISPRCCLFCLCHIALSSHRVGIMEVSYNHIGPYNHQFLFRCLQTLHWWKDKRNWFRFKNWFGIQTNSNGCVCVYSGEREREKRPTEFNELSHSGYMYPLLVMPVSRLPINFDLIFFFIIRLLIFIWKIQIFYRNFN